MLWLAFTTLRSRRNGAAGAFVAVTLAVVLITSCCILLESALRAPIAVDRLKGATVVVQAEQTLQPQDGRGNVSVALDERARLPERLANQLEAVPGVQAVIADRTFVTQIVDSRGRLVTGPHRTPTSGHGWNSAALTPLALVRGHAPRDAADVVLDRGLHVGLGARLRIATATGERTFTVVGIVAPKSDESSAFFRDDVARSLSGHTDQVDLFGVIAKPRTATKLLAARINEALGQRHVRVLTGSKRGEAESVEAGVAREDVVAGLTVFASLAAFVAIFVVASTFAVSIQQRHRELALIRAIGSTPRQVRRMVAGEALALSVLAAVVAIPLSILFALFERPLFASVQVLPSDLELVIGWMPFVAGLAAAVVTTQLAAFASARRASRVRPSDALREAAVQRRPIPLLRGLLGLAILTGGVALVVTLSRRGAGGGDGAPAVVFVLIVAAALLGPLLAFPFVWLIGAPFAFISRGSGFLAMANARSNLRRVASLATPLMLTVALAATMVFGRTTLERQTREEAERSIAAGHVLVPGDGATGLLPGIAAAARGLPGVAAASGTFGTSVVVAGGGGNLRSLPARAVDPKTLPQVVALGVTAGSMAQLRGASLAVSEARARDLGWHLGQSVKVWFGDGTPELLRVAALYERPLGFGDIVLPRRLAAAHVTDATDDAVFVKSAPRVSVAALKRVQPSVEVLTRSEYLDQVEVSARQQSLVIYVLLAVVAGFSLVAVVNALTMAITERRRELALLRLVGATTAQVKKMVQAETLIIAVVGTVLGALTAAPGLVVYSRNLTGSAVPAVPAWMAGALLAGCIVLPLAASIVPTRLALRADPAEAAGLRE